MYPNKYYTFISLENEELRIRVKELNNKIKELENQIELLKKNKTKCKTKLG